MLLLQFLEKWLVDRAMIDRAKISVFADQGKLVAGCCADDPEYESHYTANVLMHWHRGALFLTYDEWLPLYQKGPKASF